MDASDVAVDDGVMIAFLPADEAEWSKLDLPHMTLVYAGKKSDLSPTDFSALAKDAATVALLTRPFSLKVMGIENFGEGFDAVNVLRFRPTPELLALRKIVENWNASKHPFTPHATIGPATTYVGVPPFAVYFDRLVLAWGTEQIVFSLR